MHRCVPAADARPSLLRHDRQGRAAPRRRLATAPRPPGPLDEDTAISANLGPARASEPRCRALRFLDVRYNAIGATGATALAVALGRADSALRVWVTSNAYNDQDAADLAALLSVDPTTAPLAERGEMTRDHTRPPEMT